MTDTSHGRKRRKQPLSCAILIAGLALLPQGLGTSLPRAEEATDFLVVLEEEEPQSTYPLFAHTMSEQRLSELLFDRLFFQSVGGDIDTRVFAPQSTATPPSMTLIIADGLKFADGTAVDFEDVVFTINDVYRQSGLGHKVDAWYSRVFGDAETVTPTAGSVRFLVSMPETGAARYLQTTYLLSQDALTEGGARAVDLEATKRRPMGTGPFYAASAIDNFDDVRLVRNPHRKVPAGGGQRPIGGVRLLYDQDAARQGELMEGNRADLWVAPPAAVLPPFRSQRERYGIRSYHLNQWWYLAIDHGNSHLSLPAVREALDRAVPRKQLMDKFGGEETAQLTSGPFLPSSAWAPADVSPTSEARQRAVELLKGAGYRQQGGSWVSSSGDAITLRLGVQADILDDYNDVVYGLLDAWEGLGIRVRVRGIRSGDWSSIVAAGKASQSYDMILGRWNVDREEASLELFRKAGTYGQQTNLFNWSSPQVEGLLKDFYEETSGPAREALMQKLHRHLAKERPYLFLWTLQVQSLYRKDRISGFRPSSYYYFTDIDRVAWREPPGG